MEKIKCIITGSTGMVGEGVLLHCLNDEKVASILVVNRRPCGYQHPKLKEIIHKDFLDVTSLKEHFIGYNACFFCLGVSSVGLDNEIYYEMTYTLTLHFAETIAAVEPNLSFCYISGSGTDSSEKGRLNWARVKGKTENDLFKLPFKQAFAVRPGFIKPLKGQTQILPAFKYLGWVFPIGRMLSKAMFCKVEEIAGAMIFITLNGNPSRFIEGADIVYIGQKYLSQKPSY